MMYPFAVDADMPRPGYELLAAPFADETVVRGHMLRSGGVPVLLSLPCMGGQAFVPTVYLDEAIGVDDLDLLADMPVSYTMVMLVLSKVDVAVLVDGALAYDLISYRFNGRALSSCCSTSLNNECREYSLPLNDLSLCVFRSSDMALLISALSWKVLLRKGANTRVDYPDRVLDDGLVPRLYALVGSTAVARITTLGLLEPAIFYLHFMR